MPGARLSFIVLIAAVALWTGRWSPCVRWTFVYLVAIGVACYLFFPGIAVR